VLLKWFLENLDFLTYGNRLASFSDTLIGLLNLPLARLLSIFFANLFIYHHGMEP